MAPEEKAEVIKDGVWFLGMLPYRELQLHLLFPPFPYFKVSNLGKSDANFSGENVISDFGSLGGTRQGDLFGPEIRGREGLVKHVGSKNRSLLKFNDRAFH